MKKVHDVMKALWFSGAEDAAMGVLLFGADGSGRGRAVEIAALSKNRNVTHMDFFVI
jgi:hypothetical protein